MRSADHAPDRITSLFSFGFEQDERLEERLQDLKCSGQPPLEALAGLRAVIGEEWSTSRFDAWVKSHGTAQFTETPIGRKLKGSAPDSLEERVKRLLGALASPGATYPHPHFVHTP